MKFYLSQKSTLTFDMQISPLGEYSLIKIRHVVNAVLVSFSLIKTQTYFLQDSCNL